MHSPASRATWPTHLMERCAALRDCGPAPARDALRAQTWVLLHDALLRFLASYGRNARIGREDLEDIAAAKALELLERAESGAWESVNRSPGEVVGYIARVAHNGLVDFVRRTHREVHIDDTLGDEEGSGVPEPVADGVPPESRVEAEEFCRVLRTCVERLQPRARRVWFFRAFHEMTSREIAAHPDVGIKPAHVDVMVQRAREAIRSCMKAGGLDPTDVPPGAFVRMWADLEALREPVARAPAGGSVT